MLLEVLEHRDSDETIGYYETTYSSDAILQSTYFPKTNKLYVAFKRGATYSYDNISFEIFNEFQNAPSQGVFFYKNISNNVKNHPYRKEFTLYPTELNEIKNKIVNKLNENHEGC